MNAKKEFIKSIMQVLRLEANIYTMGAIEEIIDRIEISDYTLFIAYLGERESNYEKPIESIAKGVNEFYELKTYPIIRASREKAKMLISLFYSYFYNKPDNQKTLEKIMSVYFKINGEEKRISKEDFDLVLSCKSFDIFKKYDFEYLVEIENEIFNKLIDGKIKYSIYEKIENKSIGFAQKTLGICVQALGLKKDREEY